MQEYHHRNVNVKSFTKTLFLSVIGIFLALSLCFALYQYHREKEYKIDILHSRLQMYNYELIQTLDTAVNDPNAFQSYVSTHSIDGLRVTLIDLHGNVISDSRRTDVSEMDNHFGRREVHDALSKGSGFDIKRTSRSLSEAYFYSATLFSDFGIVVRAAVPYNAQLTSSLKADNKFLYYAAFITLLLGFILYRNTHRIGEHVRYLRNFALKVEQGEEFDRDVHKKMPDDELGDISHTITTLYWKLKRSEEDKLRIKKQLTQNAAHELKTPVASIQAYLETIISNPHLNEERRTRFIERCYAQSVRMSKLLSDMSSLALLDNPLTDRNMTDTDVTQIIRTVIDDSAISLQQKNIEVKLILPPSATIRGDSWMISSIFRNLVDNAIAYATGATKLTISCLEQTDSYLFRVSDNGIGVEPQHLAHIFERFYRVDKGRSRKLGGTGLGLAIVKNAIAVHGGTVTAELTPGGGLTIEFKLMKTIC